MIRPSFPLTLAEANAPKPKPPSNVNLRAWLNYYDDLACWKATKAEALLSGVDGRDA